MTEMVGAGQAGAHLDLLGDLPSERAEGLERVDEHVLVALDPLEAATRENERLAAHDRTMLVVDGGWHDQVHRAELVFDQHEDDTVRGRRPLPRDGHPSNRHLRTIRRLFEVT